MPKFFTGFMLGVVGMLFGTSVIFAQTETEIAENFEQIQAACSSAKYYELDRPVDTVAVEYHAHMQCLFSTAATGFMVDNDDYFAKQLSAPGLDSQYNLPVPPTTPENCGDSTFVTIKANQKANSTCGKEGYLGADNSLCNVVETAFNEWCAYAEYLAFAQRTTALTAQCITTRPTEIGKCVSIEQQKIKTEEVLAYKTLEMSLEQYQDFTESWTLHSWLVVLTEALENTYRRFDMIRRALLPSSGEPEGQWSTKFHNTSSQGADSYHRE